MNANQKIIFLNCIIHQESLCKNVLKLGNLTDTVKKIVNYIWAKGLNHRQFKYFLEELGAEYKDVMYHTNVRWLSLEKVLKEFGHLKRKLNYF